MPLHLTEIEARVLGALIEKEITTPEYYPLSLNALVNACNQKSNRDPAMNLDDRAVEAALHSLSEKNLAGRADNMEGRVTKYEHRLQEVFNFTRQETAILCELLLRGPETPGELRSRAGRMQHFDDLNSVLSTLQRLMNNDPPIVEILPRQPGTKELRYSHLFAGAAPGHTEKVATAQSHTAPAVSVSSKSPIASDSARISELESQIAIIQKEVASLKQQLADLQKQFS
jgi:uncharacterized protein YceH (UPF0502 family)